MSMSDASIEVHMTFQQGLRACVALILRVLWPISIMCLPEKGEHVTHFAVRQNCRTFRGQQTGSSKEPACLFECAVCNAEIVLMRHSPTCMSILTDLRSSVCCRPAEAQEASTSQRHIQQLRSVRLRRVTLASEGGDVTVRWFEGLSKLLALGSSDEPEPEPVPSMHFSLEWSVRLEVSMRSL